MNFARNPVKWRIFLLLIVSCSLLAVVYPVVNEPSELVGTIQSQLELDQENRRLREEIEVLQRDLNKQDNTCDVLNEKMDYIEVHWVNRSRETTFGFFTLSEIHQVDDRATFKQSYINNVVAEAVKDIEELQDIQLSNRFFMSGIFNTDPDLGARFHLWFRNPGNGSTLEYTVTKTFGSSSLVPIPLTGSSPVTSIIVAVSGRPDAWKIFLENMATVLRTLTENLYLTAVFYGSAVNDENLLHFQKFVNDSEFHNYVLLETEANYTNRAEALQLGIDHWKDHPEDVLLFVTDVDVVFNAAFIRRCRRYAIAGSRVFYPVVFSLYNPALTYDKVPPLKKQLKINRDSGFWRSFGYGMVCAFQSDFQAVGGFGKRKWIDWGEEDVYLFKEFQKSPLGILRVPDPGIFHVWHPKSCPRSMKRDKRKACLATRLANEGSQTKLAERFIHFEDP